VQCSNEDPAVAKIAAPPFPASAFALPEPKLPALDLDARFAAQQANLAAAQQAQAVLVDAAQAIAKVQHGYLEASLAAARAALSRKGPAKPEIVLAEVKAAAERTTATAQRVVELAAGAQRRVVELATQRTQANADALTQLAA
jgi:hypothetical protein